MLAASVFDLLKNQIAQTASYPPLHKTQGRGTHVLGWDRRGQIEGWATRPREQENRGTSRLSLGFLGFDP